jgi:hypothetical protein
MTSLVVEPIKWFQVLIYRKQQTLSKTHNTFSYSEFSLTNKMINPHDIHFLRLWCHFCVKVFEMARFWVVKTRLKLEWTLFP